jgi:homocysteine S-methyltransferase
MHTCHGEHISGATAAAASSDQVVAVGINCTSPRYISNLLSNIPDAVKRKKSIVVYPNSGEDWPDLR